MNIAPLGQRGQQARVTVADVDDAPVGVVPGSGGFPCVYCPVGVLVGVGPVADVRAVVGIVGHRVAVAVYVAGASVSAVGV